MASSKEFLNYVIEQLNKPHDITYRPMMGEFIIYYRGLIIGGIYDDRFLVKVTKGGLTNFTIPKYAIPYPGGKNMLLIEDIDDQDFVIKIIEDTYNELIKVKKRKQR